jgi:hypothetical protein
MLDLRIRYAIPVAGAYSMAPLHNARQQSLLIAQLKPQGRVICSFFQWFFFALYIE